MHHHANLRFSPIARIGHTAIGVAPNWLTYQALSLAFIWALVHFRVAGQLGHSLDVLQSLVFGLVMLVAIHATVLVHEAGHAAVAALHGAAVRAVVLTPMGGATIRTGGLSTSATRRLAAAGPLANGLVALLILACAVLMVEPGSLEFAALLLIATFQAVAAALNLLPFGGLDGARVFGPPRIPAGN